MVLLGTGLQVQCCVQLRAPRHRRGVGTLQRAQQRAAGVLQSLEHLSCEETELGLHGLGKRGSEGSESVEIPDGRVWGWEMDPGPF